MLTWVQGDLITYISVGNVNWKSQSGKQQLFKKLIMHHHTTIAFLGIYPREMKTNVYAETCEVMPIEALLTITQNRKHPKCPSTEE